MIFPRRISSRMCKAFSKNFCSENRALRNLVPNEEMLFKATVKPEILRSCLSDELVREDYFGLSQFVDIEDMFHARIHLGHKIGTLNENMKWALYGERLGVCVFDLEITRQCLLNALNFVAHLAFNGGIFLFLTTNKSSMLMVEEMASKVKQYSHTRRWIVGTLTNSLRVNQIPVRPPDALIFLNTMTSILKPHYAIIEAGKMAIPTVGIVDSNSTPEHISYPIPGNDDSFQSLEYFMRLFCKAIEIGCERRKKDNKKVVSSHLINTRSLSD